MTDAEKLREISTMLPMMWMDDAIKDLLRKAQRLEDLDREADPRDGIMGQK